MPQSIVSATNPQRASPKLFINGPCLTLLLLVFVATSCASTGSHRSVERVLRDQESAWNRADLDEFLTGYAQDEHVVFMGATGSSRGFDAVRNNYRKSYPTKESFGQLSFSDLAFTDVDHETVLIQGRWRLAKLPDNPNGAFVLIARHTRAGWKIVSDYTTVAPPLR